ncbi:MAG: ATP-binding protein [Fusobacterium perfoetens]|uniref:AAA family ATPase n=1 Tax=Fusobacterium perfoetens TaxID=852 RepID=UPI0023F0BBA5|nr:AAA family ATPase [Fusobacterium perfoetens]MCI6153358.1 ATP-binding protein [Fusobacterium perfoetens]
MKGLAIGTDDFKKIIQENCYYVDKTLFIEEILKDKSEVKLFTRPRRFGKTLNMSMLKYFFDIENSENNSHLFKGLKIEKSSCMLEQGKYPVIFLSLKEIKGLTWKENFNKIKELIKDLYGEFLFLRDTLNIIEQRDFDKIIFMEENGNFEGSLKYLTKFLKNYYKKEVIVLIDEYDTPLISAYEHGYYDEAINFFKGLYGSVLKTNTNLKMGILTGIIKVVRAGIFSDLNNLNEHNIIDEEYDEYFGFLENEVKDALEYYKINLKIEEIHSWYNGYKFGNVKVYNPWSILKFLYSKKFESYWIGTSENYLIEDILKIADEITFNKLNKLLLGKEIEEEITGKSTLKNVLEIHDIWELLLFSGYLTINKKIQRNIYSLKIPNNEVREFFKDSFIEIAFGNNIIFNKMINNLLNNNLDYFEKNLQDIMLKHMSFNDISNLEKVYHSFILGLMISLEREYKITSNQESGLGRYDILIEPLNKNKKGYILEFKVASQENKLEEKAMEALKQIENKKYYFTLENKGIKEIILIGMAFYKKLVKIKYLKK